MLGNGIKISPWYSSDESWFARGGTRVSLQSMNCYIIKKLLYNQYIDTFIKFKF